MKEAEAAQLLDSQETKFVGTLLNGLFLADFFLAGFTSHEQMARESNLDPRQCFGGWCYAEGGCLCFKNTPSNTVRPATQDEFNRAKEIGISFCS